MSWDWPDLLNPLRPIGGDDLEFTTFLLICILRLLACIFCLPIMMIWLTILASTGMCRKLCGSGEAQQPADIESGLHANSAEVEMEGATSSMPPEVDRARSAPDPRGGRNSRPPAMEPVRSAPPSKGGRNSRSKAMERVRSVPDSRLVPRPPALERVRSVPESRGGRMCVPPAVERSRSAPNSRKAAGEKTSQRPSVGANPPRGASPSSASRTIEQMRQGAVDLLNGALEGARSNQVDVVRYAIEEEGLGPGARDGQGQSLLEVAAAQKNLAVVEYLVGRGFGEKD